MALGVRVRAALEAGASIVAGTLLYMLGRPRGLLAFAWVDFVGLGRELDAVREFVRPTVDVLPSFVLFSLPDGLWTFAFTNALAGVWAHKWSRASAPWILLAPAVSIGAEVGQGLRLVPGTFDVVDLVFLTLGAVLGLARVRLPAKSVAASAQ